MLRGLALAAVAALAGCEQSVRAVPLDDVAAAAPVEVPDRGRAIAELLRMDVPEDVVRTDTGGEAAFVWPDERTIRVRELGHVRVAGRRADYTAEIMIADDAPPLLCRLDAGGDTPELVGDVVMCGRTFEVRCSGGRAPEVGVSGFWCLEQLATLAIDRGSPRGAACGTPAVDVTHAPETVRRVGETLSVARPARVIDGATELSSVRACDSPRGTELTLYTPDGGARTVRVWESLRRAGGCDVRIRIDAAPIDPHRGLFLVGPAVARREGPPRPPPPLPALDDELDPGWGPLRHEFDLDRDGATDAIVRSGGETERLLILDAGGARWYVRRSDGRVG